MEDEKIMPEQTSEDSNGYVKYRLERANAKAEQSILEKLGAKSLDEIQGKLNHLSEVSSKLDELTQKLEQKEQAEIQRKKFSLIKKRLDSEKVFDSEALLQYIDVNSTSFQEEKIDDIVSDLKAKKPNFFSVETIKTDSFAKSAGEESRDINVPKSYLDMITDHVRELIQKK